MNALSNTQLKSLESQLHCLEKELTEQLEEGTNETATVDLDQPIGRVSRIDALGRQQIAKATAESLKYRLAETKRALTKFSSSSYGECEECGEYISFGRLQAKPEARLCIECRAEKE